MRVVAAAAAYGWDRADLRRELLADDVGQLLQEPAVGQRPEWRDISDRSPVYKSHWAHWKSLAVRDGVPERHRESADGKTKATQSFPAARLRKCWRKYMEDLPGDTLESKTLDKVRHRYYWLHLKSEFERWCKQCDTCAASRDPRTRSRGVMHQYNVGPPFERIVIDITGPFPERDRGNRYFLVAMDYFTKWPEVNAIPNQEATTVADVLVTNVFCRFGVPRELHSDQGRNFESRLMQKVLERLAISKTRTTPKLWRNT
jgi:hypothetical protein